MITPVMENAASSKLVDLTSDTDSDKGAKEFRRSHRNKKSTLVYIDGQAVLAKNNYHMKGLTYEYGKDFQTAPPEKKRKTTSNKAFSTPKAPKPRTDLETKRINHNTAVKRRVENKMHLRFQYLASHLPSLEPFLNKSVTCQLKQVSNVSSLESAELFMQPSEIQADMRDYQLAGLNWMVRMYKANLGMILGDEMGLVSCNMRALVRGGVQDASTVLFTHSPFLLLMTGQNVADHFASLSLEGTRRHYGTESRHLSSVSSLFMVP
jgi:SNF2 family DNA or RNA helicase